MKKVLSILFIIILCFSFCVGCSNGKGNNSLSKESIIEKLSEINNDLTDLWNDVIVEVDHYSGDGRSSTGAYLDIDFVVDSMDKPYNKCLKNKEFVDNLSADYSDFINAYDKAMEQAKIIYDNLKKEVPKPGVELSYANNIDLFNQYQDKFYDLVEDAYYEE